MPDTSAVVEGVASLALGACVTIRGLTYPAASHMTRLTVAVVVPVPLLAVLAVGRVVAVHAVGAAMRALQSPMLLTVGQLAVKGGVRLGAVVRDALAGLMVEGIALEALRACGAVRGLTHLAVGGFTLPAVSVVVPVSVLAVLAQLWVVALTAGAILPTIRAGRLQLSPCSGLLLRAIRITPSNHCC